MKKILLLLLTITNIQAAVVDGEIFYKKPNDEISTRQVTLEVPSRKPGEVVLRNEKFEWRTTNFKTFKKNNQTLFIALFETSFLKLFKSTVALKGTYINGSNKVLYYGDFYKKKGHDADIDTLDENLSEYTHKGGFRFEYLK